MAFVREFVEPSKRYADVIIPLGGHNTVAVDLLPTMLRSVASRPASTTYGWRLRLKI